MIANVCKGMIHGAIRTGADAEVDAVTVNGTVVLPPSVSETVEFGLVHVIAAEDWQLSEMLLLLKCLVETFAATVLPMGSRRGSC